MSHANAALTPKARLALARLVIEDGWPISRAAEHFHVAADVMAARCPTCRASAA